MIHRKLFMVTTAIIASAAITACSDTTAPKQLVPRGLPAAALLAPHPGPATVVATINGGGTAEMQVPAGLLAGTTSWGGHITLYSDGTAKGEFHCVDQMGSTAPGNVWGPVTSWSIDANGVVSLTVGSGKLVNFPGGHPQDSGTFIVRIQRYGGKGVGHWTLDVPDGLGGWLTVCDELLTSGQIVYRRE